MPKFLFDTWSNSIPLINHMIKCFTSSYSHHISTLEISPTQVSNMLIGYPKQAYIVYEKLILSKLTLV